MSKSIFGNLLNPYATALQSMTAGSSEKLIAMIQEIDKEMSILNFVVNKDGSHTVYFLCANKIKIKTRSNNGNNNGK